MPRSGPLGCVGERALLFVGERDSGGSRASARAIFLRHAPSLLMVFIVVLIFVGIVCDLLKFV